MNIEYYNGELLVKVNECIFRFSKYISDVLLIDCNLNSLLLSIISKIRKGFNEIDIDNNFCSVQKVNNFYFIA